MQMFHIHRKNSGTQTKQKCTQYIFNFTYIGKNSGGRLIRKRNVPSIYFIQIFHIHIDKNSEAHTKQKLPSILDTNISHR